MKEYGIYIRQGSGKPYMIHIYDNFFSAKIKLYDMICLDEERQRPYYVDNDFFDNKYNFIFDLKYYCIKCREVGEWKTYSKEDDNKIEDNKIIYFKDLKKQLTK